MIVDREALFGDNDSTVSMKLLARALQLSYKDPTYDTDDAEMIVACLIEQVSYTSSALVFLRYADPLE